MAKFKNAEGITDKTKVRMVKANTELNEYESNFCSNEHYLSSSSENKAWKKFGPVRDINPWPLRYHAVRHNANGKEWIRKGAPFEPKQRNWTVAAWKRRCLLFALAGGNFERNQSTFVEFIGLLMTMVGAQDRFSWPVFPFLF